jgi:hypothetical protein
MRKALLMLLLATATGSATADWVKVTTKDVFTGYADPESIHKSGESVTIWHLRDYNALQAIPGSSGAHYQSTKILEECDCKAGRMRILQIQGYSGNMGSGERVYTQSTPTKSEEVAVGSVNGAVWQVACGTSAKWVRIAIRPDGKLYGAPTTIHKVGTTIQMWAMIDYRVPMDGSDQTDKTFLSEKTLWEFDCKGRQARSMLRSLHSDNMAGGDLVHVNPDPTEWIPIVPGRFLDSASRAACGKPRPKMIVSGLHKEVDREKGATQWRTELARGVCCGSRNRTVVA